jgi:dUTPase
LWILFRIEHYSLGTRLGAAYDLYSAYDYTIPIGGRVFAKTDLQIKVPTAAYGRVAPLAGRSVEVYYLFRNKTTWVYRVVWIGFYRESRMDYQR